MSVQSCASWRRVMHSVKGKPAVRAQEQRQQKSSSLQPHPFPWHSMGKGTWNTSSIAHIACGERKFNQCKTCCCWKKNSCKGGERGPHPHPGPTASRCLSFPFSKAGLPNTSPFLKPSDTEPAPAALKAQASAVHELAHSRGAQRQVFHALKK